MANKSGIEIDVIHAEIHALFVDVIRFVKFISFHLKQRTLY